MRFINKTKNTINLSEVNLAIPYLGEQEQDINSDTILRSPSFQHLCITKQFEIVYANESRIEQNLWLMQNQAVPTIRTPEQIPKVLFRGHVSGHTGYAKANRNIFYALARQGLEMYLDPIQGIEGNTGVDKARLQPFVRIPHPNSILIHSAVPTFAEESDARYRVLYTTVESATVPEQFIKACNEYDEVWTTSTFCHTILKNGGVEKPITLIPNSVDTRVYNEKVRPHRFSPPLRDFKFVSVSSWNHRKGVDVLLKAYLTAFTRNDPVTLLLVTNYQRDSSGSRLKKVENEIREAIEKYGGTSPAHIARCGINVPEEEMPRLYRACDAFVLPSRGEGFGLPYMEASLCGLPVIATNHSGHTMFLNENNSFLMEIDKLVKIEDRTTNVHYWDGQYFPDLNDHMCIEELGRLMRYVYENKADAKKRNQQLQEDILSNYSCEMVGAIAKQRIEDIWTQLLSY